MRRAASGFVGRAALRLAFVPPAAIRTTSAPLTAVRLFAANGVRLQPVDGALPQEDSTGVPPPLDAEPQQQPPPEPESVAPPTSTASAPAANNDGGVRALLDEIDMIVHAPMPIGTLFKTLSADARKWLNEHRLPLETFLLRHPGKYSVYKQRFNGPIYVAKLGMAPKGAAHGTETTGDKIFQVETPTTRANAKGITNTQKVYTVLKYIPNEWVSYTMLNIPKEVRKSFIGKPARRFFEVNRRHFEVRFDPHFPHTFDVRRSEALQQYMAAQEAQRQGGGAPAQPPPADER